MTDSGKLPFSLFTTSRLRPRDQFEAWHESISVIFDVAPPAEHQPDSGFAATVRGWHLGGLLISQVDFDGQRFVRDRRKTIADGLDHYLVQLYATGGLVGEAGDQGRVLNGGDVQILDLTQSNVTQAAPSGTVAIVVPRETLDQALSAPGDLHGLILRGHSGMGGLLGDYMHSLVSRAESMTLAEAPLVAQATTEMIAACFQSSAETTERARAAIDQTMRQRIQRHISAHLDSPALGAEALCAQFRISRSQLYRLFEPLGGVAHYVQEQRVTRACAELCNPAHDHRRIYEIAFALGFSSEAHFSRVFRSTFGLSPSDVRGRAQATRVDRTRPEPADIANGGYEEWVRQLK
ncbi:MAG TPA: helix-turn-helix domain-containing protein [Reyranella sp.]|jgi:AraC-like DNA-binding protein|nr:helix-turn-helix domain-containing protein [Reyranella sp.]